MILYRLISPWELIYLLSFIARLRSILLSIWVWAHHQPSPSPPRYIRLRVARVNQEWCRDLLFFHQTQLLFRILVYLNSSFCMWIYNIKCFLLIFFTSFFFICNSPRFCLKGKSLASIYQSSLGRLSIPKYCVQQRSLT